MEGDKESCLGEEVAVLVYAVVSINYRFSDEAIVTAQIYDAKEAVRWLRQNASLYNIDSDRFGVWGDSSDGQLSALLGTSAGVLKV
ncbi:MAG: alpha/beta hydrolase [Dehalococcoidales bacterium]|nr:alpha/beta hydrolase [Dehalococcoidales bacterium]